VTNGLTSQPNPGGMPRVSEIDSHSTYTPPGCSRSSHYEFSRHR
jgi:hypothetical protein